ncbi:MAG: hypothetical protein QME77_12985 [bacterium]|nr:hypothetical protein [bacterium]
MARLEGAYEQINARLGGVKHRHRLGTPEQRFASELATLRSEMREDTADPHKRLDLIPTGVFFVILLRIATRVFFP